MGPAAIGVEAGEFFEGIFVDTAPELERRRDRKKELTRKGRAPAGL